MAEETDGIEEAFEDQLRVLVSVAGQVGEQLARAREEALRHAQARGEQEHRQTQSRIEAERQAARGEMTNVHHSQWWDTATPEVIGRTYQTARTWSQDDPEAARAEQRMNDELRARYGMDVNSARAAPAVAKDTVGRARQERAQADAERTRAASENAGAQRLGDHAHLEDRRAAETRAEVEDETDPDERARAAAEAQQREAAADRAYKDGRTMYDSSERREGTARELESRGINKETVATRMRADVSQAKPATEAVKAHRSKPPKGAFPNWGV